MTTPLPENFQPPKDNPYDYNTALRERLGQIASWGDQQNQYAAQQGLANQQSSVDQQNDVWQSQQQGAQTSNAAWGGKDSGQAYSPNPRNVQQALAFAKQAAASGQSGWYRRCLAFVASAYGLGGSGTNYAIDAFTRLPQSQQHVDRNPTVGSLMFWKGSGRAGHVAIYAGNGMIYSTDIGGAGRVSLVPMNAPETSWGQKYYGWSEPYFASSPRR